MAEGFADELIASQNTMMRRCERMCSCLKITFRDHLLDKDHNRNFFLDFSEPANGTFYVWFFDKKKAPTNFGLKLVGISTHLEVTLVKKYLEDIITYKTENIPNLFPCGNPKYLVKVDDVQECILHIASLFLKETVSDIFKPKNL